jgi:hypothetical protein
MNHQHHCQNINTTVRTPTPLSKHQHHCQNTNTTVRTSTPLSEHQHHCQNTNSETLRTDKGSEILVTVWFESFCVPLCCLQHEDYKHNNLELDFLFCMGVRLCIILRVKSRMRLFNKSSDSNIWK